MMTYYQTNAIYDALEKTQGHPFSWVAGSAWSLIYGDESGNPKVVVLVYGESSPVPQNVLGHMRWISDKSGLPLLCVAFDDTAKEITSVQISEDGGDSWGKLELDELRSKFEHYGLAINQHSTSKAINDQSSSAYHNWQRNHLGRNITVSDIDLMRLSDGGVPIEILELKRSFYELQRWSPFRDDYPNFNLLRSLADMCAINMTIAYNVRHKKPFRDDASTLSIFDYQRNNPSHIGCFSFSDFVQGTYL